MSSQYGREGEAGVEGAGSGGTSGFCSTQTGEVGSPYVQL